MQVFTVQFERENGATKTGPLARGEVVAADTIGGTADRGVYKLIVGLAESVSEAFEPDFGDAQVELIVITADDQYETKVSKEYGGFNEFQESCEAHGALLDLVSIVLEGSASDEPTDNLTDHQREVLTLTASHDHYEGPRQTTAEELVAELGISQPPLSSLLRHGERELIISSLGMQTRMQSPTQ